MNLLQRWCLLITVAILNTELFDFNDYQFWIITVVIAIVCAPLHENKTDSK